MTFGGTAASSFSVTSDFQIVATLGSGGSGDVVATSSSGSGTRSGFTFSATTQASAITFSNVQSNQLCISWTNGTADKRIVFVKEGSGVFSNPVNNTTYTASSDWGGKGTQISSSGYYCVYNNTGSSVTVTNLSANTIYTVQVLEYNGTAGAEYYFTSTALNNPNNRTTLGVLPLTWLDFSVKPRLNQAVLQWTTSQETNTAGFTIQHSTDGQQWGNIGYQPAANRQEMENRYAFVHSFPVNGKNYYRIEESDIDGQICYSRIITLQHGNRKMELLNTLVTDGKISLQLEETATVSLFNSQGQLVLTRHLPAGNHILEAGHLINGVYYLRSGAISLKLVIQQ